MEQLTITLPDKIATQLKTVARNSGVKPEDLMLVSLQEKLASLDFEFIQAMKYVLKKNAELYKRLG
ncbi:MAG: DNA-binding protein [candidate division KSB1 bacterium]|nr:DNA-binding protein [candidate division KSB1 bacterium]MDZ7303861.1 DNA-binding protein [candidate division KSB1 bacterium]MDZ7313215.1 DNA-binding protein [candidate division KSB1 bacterium]